MPHSLGLTVVTVYCRAGQCRARQCRAGSAVLRIAVLGIDSGWVLPKLEYIWRARDTSFCACGETSSLVPTSLPISPLSSHFAPHSSHFLSTFLSTFLPTRLADFPRCAATFRVLGSVGGWWAMGWGRPYLPILAPPAPLRPHSALCILHSLFCIDHRIAITEGTDACQLCR